MTFVLPMTVTGRSDFATPFTNEIAKILTKFKNLLLQNN